MLIKTFVAGPFDANNYLVIDEESKEAFLVDCSDYVQEIVDIVNQMELTVKYILITHGHFDHVLGINQMKAALGADVYVPREDIIIIENINQAASHFAGSQVRQIPVHDHVYEPGIVFEIGKEHFTVIKTPGHTEGSVCITGGHILFSGDTLFRDTFGRTDLFGGNIKKLVNSITNVLFFLPEDTVVYTGHNAFTTIGYEKVHNAINKYIR